MTQTWFRSLALAMALVMGAVSLPTGQARAAFVSTEDGLAPAAETDETRARLSAFLARQDVQEELKRLGVEPSEAAARVAALSDEEAEAISGKLAELPAGQDFGVIIAAALTIFIILLVTDILGLTSIFPFVKRR